MMVDCVPVEFHLIVANRVGLFQFSKSGGEIFGVRELASKSRDLGNDRGYREVAIRVAILADMADSKTAGGFGAGDGRFVQITIPVGDAAVQLHDTWRSGERGSAGYRSGG